MLFRDDMTATAIGGTAASVVFNTGRLGKVLGEAIREGDNALGDVTVRRRRPSAGGVYETYMRRIFRSP